MTGAERASSPASSNGANFKATKKDEKMERATKPESNAEDALVNLGEMYIKAFEHLFEENGALRAELKELRDGALEHKMKELEADNSILKARIAALKTAADTAKEVTDELRNNVSALERALRSTRTAFKERMAAMEKEKQSLVAKCG